MDKPVFLLCPGMTKSGTTTLCELLKTYNTFIHCGISKEPAYLMLTDMYHNRDRYKTFFDDLELNLRKKLKSFGNHIIYPNSIKHLKTQLPEKIYSDYTSQYYSLSTYYNYYVNLYEIIKPTYYGVSDFSAHYGLFDFNYQFLKEVDTCLSKFFTVKVVLLFREPLKRAFSHAHMRALELNTDNANVFSAIDIFNSDITLTAVQRLYPDVYHKFHSVFQDRLLLLNETVFDPNDHTQRSQLENFLNIPKIFFENFPIINAQTYHEFLSDDDILKAKELLKPSYDFYHQTFIMHQSS